MLKFIWSKVRKTDTDTKRQEMLKVGAAVFILLAMVTVGEFMVGAIAPMWSVVLLGAAILKAFFIIRDYMHIGRLFSPEEESHS